MKRKTRSGLALVIAMSLALTLLPGFGAEAKSKKTDKVMKEAESIKAASNDQPVADGTYRIMTALDTSKGMDLAGNSTAQGTNVQLYQVTYSDVWFFDVKYMGDGYYKISVPGTSMCLDHALAEKKDGANFWLWGDNGTDAQRFKFETAGNGFYYIRSKVDGRCVDVDHLRTENRTNIMMQTKNGGLNQKWKFEPESKPVKDGKYRIMSKLNESMGLDLEGGSKNEGTNIVLNTVSAENVPLMEIKYDSRGYYRISVADTSLYLDEADYASKDGSNLWAWKDDKDSYYERWRFEDAGDGYFYIRGGADKTGRVIDVSGSSATKNANVHLWSFHGGNNQKWKLVEEQNPKLEDISPFSMVGAVRFRWSSEIDLNNRVYKIDKTFPKGTKTSIPVGLFSSTTSIGGFDVKYRENEEGSEWTTVDVPVSGNGQYVDVNDLTPGGEYIFKVRPYYVPTILGIPMPGMKNYKQDWSKEIKRKTLESNNDDIKTGDGIHDSIAAVAQKNGWYSGMHNQNNPGRENSLYSMVCKNKDFQIWIGYQVESGKLCYSWQIYDYKKNIYKAVYRGTMKDLKNDLAVYAPGSSKPRLSTEYVKYEKGKEATVSLVNMSGSAKWSLAEPKDPRVQYGGVEIKKSSRSNVTILFTKKKSATDIYPYIQAEVGGKTYKCYIQSGVNLVW